MKCPYCGSKSLSVIETREAENATRRRRRCSGCKKRFTTYERAESIPLIVIKKDNTRERFDKDKILKGLLRACEKRPVSLDMLKKTADEIELRLLSKGGREVKSIDIGRLVMNKLKAIDKVAYIRFASVYKEFDDAASFISEIKLIKNRESSKKKRNKHD